MAFELVRAKNYGLSVGYTGEESLLSMDFTAWELPGVTAAIQGAIEFSSQLPVGIFDRYLRMEIWEDDDAFTTKDYRVNIWIAAKVDTERSGSIGEVSGPENPPEPVGAAIGFVFTTAMAIAVVGVVLALGITVGPIGWGIKNLGEGLGKDAPRAFLLAAAVVALGLGSLAIVLAFKNTGQQTAK